MTHPPLPPLHMPTGGAFSALFPPILDWQSRAEITGKRAAAAAGTLPPLLAVPELATPEPGFVLDELDGDADGRGRVVGVLESRYEEEERDVGREAAATPLRVDDIWSQAAEGEAGPSHRGFELRSWETPSTPSPLRPPPAPIAFDPLEVEPPEPIALPRLNSPGALPAADAVSLLDHLVDTALVAPPPGLRWSRSKSRFAYDAKHGDRSSAGFVEQVLMIATAIRRLEIVAAEESESLTPTHHAFLYALNSVIEYMKHRLTDMDEPADGTQGTPWLSRSLALEDVTVLGHAMCQVACWPLSEPKAVGLPARPSSLLTHVYNHLTTALQNRVSSQLHVTLCLAYLLQASTTPYLELLHQWIGVADSSRADEDVRPESQPWQDLGITRSLLPANGVHWEYSFSPRRMPAFIPPDMRRTFFEAGRSLRALREASDGLHPLCWTDWPIKATWGWGEGKEDAYDLRHHARRVQRQIDKWRSATMAKRPARSRAISLSSMGSRRRQESVFTSPPASRPLSPVNTDDVWLAAAAQTSPSKPKPLWSTASDLEAFISRHSDPAHPLLPQQSLEDYIASYLLAPPLAHATLISRALVSHYLDDLHFLDHLDVLHAFWLGGDAGFTERVGAALFGKDGGGEDVGLGRRARTRARLGIGESGNNTREAESSGAHTPAPSVLDTPLPTPGPTTPPPEWGIGLGIGLSDRRRWPPGGAELAYALRTTLFDHDIELFASRGPVWAGIEDRVSFALRALPEDEGDERRAQWLNPQAVEALDFLYLVYSPPAAIAPLLPSAIMDKYQVVHNLLLRLARVDAVLRGLYFDILRPDSSASTKVGVDAHHSRPASTINVPTVHLPILGVFDPKSPTARSLRHLRFLMSAFVTAFSRYVLDTVGHNSAVMHRRLASLHRGAVSSAAGVGLSRDPSRPLTPAWMILDDDELDYDADGFDDSQAQLAAISQLQSAHSLVLYHHIILNRVTRACLLSRGSSGAFGALMALLRLVLDLGKAVKEIERGVLPAEDGAEIVALMRTQWDETYADFIKAVERLTRQRPEEDEQPDDTGDEHDLQILLGTGSGRNTDLRELLLRLRLGQGSGIVARWDQERREERAGKETVEVTEAKEAKEVKDAMDVLDSAATARPSTPSAPPAPVDDATPRPPRQRTPQPRRPSATALNLALEMGDVIELADDLEMTPAPLVHGTKVRTPPPLPRAQESVLTPQRLFELQTRPAVERSRSDDEISLD